MEGQEKTRWSFEESDLNNIHADHYFKAEQSKSNEVQYLSRRNSITQQWVNDIKSSGIQNTKKQTFWQKEWSLPQL